MLTKMAAMTIYGKKHFKIFYPGTNGLIFGETLYKASDTLALYILFKLCDWVDLGKVKFCNIGFYMRKYDNDGFFVKYCIL